jgi:hypothetical protein
LSVATILPTAVKASDMARIAPRIVPMIRRMSPVCAGAWLQDGASSDELAGLRQNVPDRLSRSLAGPSAAGTAAPSPRRGGQGELHKSRSCRRLTAVRPVMGGTDGGIRKVEPPQR